MQKRPPAYLCGVPKGSCRGTFLATNHIMGDGNRAHGSPEEAFNCMRRHLIASGFTQCGSREFRPPDGGPIRILTKKARYGAKLRNGKEGTRNMPVKMAGNRHGGIVTSC